jgi:hypothetical protein
MQVRVIQPIQKERESFMATWSTQASSEMRTFSTTYHLTQSEVNSLRTKIASWADVIGILKKKVFTIRNYRITATAQNHVILAVLLDM